MIYVFTVPSVLIAAEERSSIFFITKILNAYFFPPFPWDYGRGGGGEGREETHTDFIYIKTTECCVCFYSSISLLNCREENRNYGPAGHT